jgi:hypothetical protein
MFVKKPGERICFCIDYRLFNAIIKKDWYLILLIKCRFTNSTVSTGTKCHV